MLEVEVVVILGALLAATRPSWVAIGLAALLLLVIRPATVVIGLAGSRASGVD